MLGYLKQLKMRQKAIWGVILAIVVLVVPFFCNATITSHWNITFEDLEIGELAGQDYFSGESGYFSVSNEEAFEGIKSGKANVVFPDLREITFDPPDIRVGDINEVYFLHFRGDITPFLDIQFLTDQIPPPTYPDFQLALVKTDPNSTLLLRRINLVNCETGEWDGYASTHFLADNLPDDEWVEVKILIYNNHSFKVGWSAPYIPYTESTFCFWFSETEADVILDKLVFFARTNNYFDEFKAEGIPPELEGQVWGINPNSGTEITDLNTTLTIGYQDLGNYDSLYVALKHPQTGLFTNAKKYDILDIGSNGELGINLQNFNIEKNANWYLHAVATYEGYQYEDELFLSDYGWNWTGDLTDGSYYLDVNIEGFEEIFAMSDFNSWYAEYSKFDEPTEMFSSIVGTFSPIFSVIGEFGNRIKNYFDVNSAYSKGYEIGKAIPIFSYYTGQITHFLGGFPIISWLLIIILILVGIFIFRIILKFIPFLGGS